MESFKAQCLDYIQSAFEKEIQLPSHSKIEINENGIINYHIKINSIIVGKNIRPHRYIDYLTVFMLFDAFLEKQIPALIEKQSFDAKLNILPNESKTDKIQKELYRYIIIIRNSIVHHLEEIKVSEDSIFMEYVFNHKKNSLKVSLDSVNSIISYIAYRVKNEIINEYYFRLYIEEYYKRVLKGIQNCEYKGNPITPEMSISDSFSFNRNYVFIKNNEDEEEKRSKLVQANLFNETDYIFQNREEQFIIPGVKFQGIEKMKESSELYFV